MSHIIDAQLEMDFRETSEKLNVEGLDTLNSLIRQNEELSSKLRAQMRKTMQFESENVELTKKIRATNEKLALLEEQILILRQKESSLLEKIEQGTQALARESQLEGVIQEQQSVIERHLRYQEKIRTQVKPYIQQLKKIASEAHHSAQQKSEIIMNQESQIQKLKDQIEALQFDYTQLQKTHDLQIHELKAHFEKERNHLRHEFEELKLRNQELQKKATLVDIAHFRQNELENQLIATKAQYEEKIEQLRLENTKILSELSKLLPENQYLKQNQTQLENKINALNIKEQHNMSLVATLEKQLQLLREQWTDKLNECEKLKLQLSSLESLNQDLTKRLNLARKGQPTL